MMPRSMTSERAGWTTTMSRLEEPERSDVRPRASKKVSYPPWSWRGRCHKAGLELNFTQNEDVTELGLQ